MSSRSGGPAPLADFFARALREATGAQFERAATFTEGLRSVLLSGREEFTLEYPCHSPSERGWFVGRVRRFPASGTPLAMVAHESVTDRKLLEERLENQ